MNSSFTPRRSPRLAAKASTSATTSTASTAPHTTSQPHMYVHEVGQDGKCSRCGHTNGLTREDARAIFRAHVGMPPFPEYDISKSMIVSVIKQYLNDVEASVGKIRKAYVAINLMKYLSQNPVFMARNERFYKTVINKMKEFQAEVLEDPALDKEFKSTVEDLLFITDAL